MTLRLTRLDASLPITADGQGPHTRFMQVDQKVKEALEAQEATQDTLIQGLADAVADIATAQADIITALANAGIALSTATASARETARINSYTTPTNVLTAADVGSDCTITIANHTRVYPVQGSIDVPDVAITGGTITGLAFATEFYVYYDDTTLEDTTPSFLSTETAATAQVGAAAGRHFVGVITTPTDGGGGTGGSGGTPPGGGGGNPLP